MRDFTLKESVGSLRTGPVIENTLIIKSPCCTFTEHFPVHSRPLPFLKQDWTDRITNKSILHLEYTNEEVRCHSCSEWSREPVFTPLSPKSTQILLFILCFFSVWGVCKSYRKCDLRVIVSFPEDGRILWFDESVPATGLEV